MTTETFQTKANLMLRSKKSSTIFPHWSGRAKSHSFRLCEKPFFQVVRKAMVSAVDEAVGNIIEALETTGVKWGWGSIVLILTLLIRKCNWNGSSLCGACWQIFHSKTFLLAAKCENMKRRPIIEFSAFSLKAHNYCKSVQKIVQSLI